MGARHAERVQRAHRTARGMLCRTQRMAVYVQL
jgi:hypothetical protein